MGLELYAEKDGKGMVKVSFEARNWLRHIRSAEENKEHPGGKLLKPLFIMGLTVFWHTAAVTGFPASPSAYFGTFARSGSQRESRPGHGAVNKEYSDFCEIIRSLDLPNRFFMPSVLRNAGASDSPSHPDAIPTTES